MTLHPRQDPRTDFVIGVLMFCEQELRTIDAPSATMVRYVIEDLAGLTRQASEKEPRRAEA